MAYPVVQPFHFCRVYQSAQLVEVSVQSVALVQTSALAHSSALARFFALVQSVALVHVCALARAFYSAHFVDRLPFFSLALFSCLLHPFFLSHHPRNRSMNPSK
jgi:hypothetical protein